MNDRLASLVITEISKVPLDVAARNFQSVAEIAASSFLMPNSIPWDLTLTTLTDWALFLDSASTANRESINTKYRAQLRDLMLSVLKLYYADRIKKDSLLKVINQTFRICFSMSDFQRCQDIFHQSESARSDFEFKMSHQIQFQLNVGRTFLYFHDFAKVKK